MIFIIIDSFESYYLEIDGKKYEFLLEDNENAKIFEEKFPITDTIYEKHTMGLFFRSKNDINDMKGALGDFPIVKGNILLFKNKITLCFKSDSLNLRSYFLGKVVEQDVDEFCSVLEQSSGNIKINIIKQDKQEEKDDKEDDKKDNKNVSIIYTILISMAILIIFLITKILLLF